MNMSGRNRFSLGPLQRKAASDTGAICVFISHQQSDIAPAKALADFLLNDIEVDVYFDAYDYALAAAATANDEAKIVELIEDGLAASTHLLGVLSSRSRGSWWVPFEIGSARARDRPLAHIVLEDITDLPCYLLNSKLLVDHVDLASWARRLKNQLFEKSLDSFEPTVSIPHLPLARLTPPPFRRT